MTQDGDGGGDPFELDPFGSSEYDPTRAFAYLALTRTEKLVQQADEHVAQELRDYADRSNQIAMSARRSMKIYQDDLHLLLHDARQAYAADDGVQDTIDAFHRARGVHERLIDVSEAIRTEDPVLRMAMEQKVDPASLLDPRPASGKVLNYLRSFLTVNWGNAAGSAVIVKATPGVGKTYAMLQTAYERYLAGGRVAVAARTKEMIDHPNAELVRRVQARSPAGKLHLAVIHGRDATNCYKFEAVQAVMAHGYAPFVAVCKRCEYYPGNSQLFGLGVCKYYDDRIAADLVAKAARQGRARHYPFVLTTHASVVAASQVSGGQHGGFWNVDGIYFDEDPTDSMEVDNILTEQHAEFESASADTQSAGIIAKLYREAIDIARRERSLASQNGFKAADSEQFNSHSIHTRYDSVYVGEDLYRVLEEARCRIGTTIAVESLKHMFRSVSDGRGFHVDTGALADVDGTEDINALDVPPKTLADTAGAIHQEMNHALALRRAVYAETHGGDLPVASNMVELLTHLEDHTDLGEMSYHVRLECLPLDVEKGRLQDEWRFVVREKRDLDNRTATIIVGDAYAHKEHYTQLFERPVTMIDVKSELNPEARLTRILDDRCNISSLRRGDLQRVLGFVESQMMQDVQPEERVLLYTHMELVPTIQEWMEGVANRLGVDRWAVEHWWGGRGKDQYNGWENTFLISDPVLSLSGIKHVANARAWRASLRAKDLENRLMHARRCELGNGSNGAVAALRGGHPRIALEHERMNIAELTQALHRSRPAHNPVRIFVYGQMEMGRDLVAQTHTYVPPSSRKVRKSNSQRKKRATKRVTAVDRFVTQHEAEAAIRAVIAHYGVWSLWFAHALQVTFHVGSLTKVWGPNGDKPWESLDKDNHRSINAPALIRNLIKGRGINSILSTYSGGEVHSQSNSDRRGSTESGLPLGWEPPRVLPDPAPVIDRIWHPPVYWRTLVYAGSMPKAIRAAHSAVLQEAKAAEGGLRFVQLQRRPSWDDKRRGKHPTLIYDESLLDNVSNAIEHYMDIVEHQYASRVFGGKLIRTKPRLEVPGSLSDVPF